MQHPLPQNTNDSFLRQFQQMRVGETDPDLQSQLSKENPHRNLSRLTVSPSIVYSDQQIEVQIWLHVSECIRGRYLVIGLYRTSQVTNDKPIFVKQVRFESKLRAAYSHVTSRIVCKSPKFHGVFEFRLLEQLTLDGKRMGLSSISGQQKMGQPVSYSEDIIAKSPKLRVCMGNAGFVDSLNSIQSKLRIGLQDGDAKTVLNSLTSFLRLIENLEHESLNKIDLFESVLTDFFPLIEKAPDEINTEFCKTETINCSAASFHSVLRNIFMLILRNNTARSMLSLQMCDQSEHLMKNSYCDLTGLIFRDPKVKEAYWKQRFDFDLIENAPNHELVMTSTFVQTTLSDWIERVAAQLIPDATKFDAIRRSVYDRIMEHLICKLGPCARLYVFGSSANSFGMQDSDMDLGLMFTNKNQHSYSEKKDILSRVVAFAKEEPDLFTDVDTSRLSARIPIIMFKDKETGLQCDLCMDNVLALRNTALLRAYAHSDLRVRKLAYVLKHFVKQRRMNSPSDGTLSSYAYILMLIHFLQRQEPPVIPVLQTLPPNWDGTRKCVCTHANRLCHTGSPQCQLTERINELNLPSIPVQAQSPGEDLAPCETYFYDPFDYNVDSVQRLRYLQAVGLDNHRCIGELFMRFLLYYSVDFDSCNEIVTIRMGRNLTRAEKYHPEGPYFQFHTRISVEDPFETGYDVAHVLKDSRHRYIRQQFARAYVKLAEASRDSHVSHEAMETLMGDIFQTVQRPPFHGKGTPDPEPAKE